jgi:excisionase family DNA binding protein
MANVLTLEELASYLRVHRSTVYRMLKKGQIPAFKVGSDWRFNLESIDLWRAAAEQGYAKRAQ